MREKKSARSFSREQIPAHEQNDEGCENIVSTNNDKHWNSLKRPRWPPTATAWVQERRRGGLGPGPRSEWLDRPRGWGALRREPLWDGPLPRVGPTGGA